MAGEVRAVLQISAAAFEEIKERLERCGWKDACVKTVQTQEVIDFGEVGLTRETDEKVRVYLVFDGKIVKGDKHAVSNTAS